MSIDVLGHGAWDMGHGMQKKDPRAPCDRALVPTVGGRATGVPEAARPTAPLPHAPCQAPKAFSLVELVISLGILSVGLVGAMRVFPVGLRASQRSEMVSRAAILAQRTAETLKLQPWDDLAEGETTSEEEAFEVTTIIRHPSVETLVDPARVKAVEVIVRWDQNGRPRALSVVTYLRRDDLA